MEMHRTAEKYTNALSNIIIILNIVSEVDWIVELHATLLKKAT